MYLTYMCIYLEWKELFEGFRGLANYSALGIISFTKSKYVF